MHKSIIAGALATVIVSPALMSAQQQTPKSGTPGVADQPREVMPTNPGQPAPKPPYFDQILPGQHGTIPEVIERPRGAKPHELVVSPGEVRKAQEALKARGYDPGAMSGNLHAGTQEALRRFQKDNNLTATGALDQETARKLGIDNQRDQPKPSQNKPSGDQRYDETLGKRTTEAPRMQRSEI